MNYQSIKKQQKEWGFDTMQTLIDNGSVWRMEGSMGREASRLLEVGACMLPKVSFRDYYGNLVPSRDQVKEGSKGSYQNCKAFYIKHEAVLYF